jgi:hypothetical protein
VRGKYGILSLNIRAVAGWKKAFFKSYNLIRRLWYGFGARWDLYVVGHSLIDSSDIMVRNQG